MKQKQNDNKNNKWIRRIIKRFLAYVSYQEKAEKKIGKEKEAPWWRATVQNIKHFLLLYLFYHIKLIPYTVYSKAFLFFIVSDIFSVHCLVVAICEHLMQSMCEGQKKRSRHKIQDM